MGQQTKGLGGKGREVVANHQAKVWCCTTPFHPGISDLGGRALLSRTQHGAMQQPLRDQTRDKTRQHTRAPVVHTALTRHRLVRGHSCGS